LKGRRNEKKKKEHSVNDPIHGGAGDVGREGTQTQLPTVKSGMRYRSRRGRVPTGDTERQRKKEDKRFAVGGGAKTKPDDGRV